MIKRFTENMCLILTICSGSLIMFEIFIPKAMAYRKHGVSNINEFLVENQRTHMTKQNYVLQHNIASDLLEKLVSRTKESNYERKSEELPGLIVDYANMIRNDIILLDNSVETRTRKRDNIKVGEIVLPPCACEDKVPGAIILGEDHYPTSLKNVTCNNTLCPKSYLCQKRIYEHKVLKLRDPMNPEEKDEGMGRWITKVVPVVSGCMCNRDYTVKNKY